MVQPGNTNWRGRRLSMVDLLIEVIGFVIKPNNIFKIKSN
jgi:hypothetical protein